MTKLIKNFINDESGATAIEYGLIAALIAVALIAGMGALAPKLENILKGIGTSLEENTPA